MAHVSDNITTAHFLLWLTQQAAQHHSVAHSLPPGENQEDNNTRTTELK